MIRGMKLEKNLLEGQLGDNKKPVMDLFCLEENVVFTYWTGP